ncbi:uncharacterized protein [Onthophagus taurus]|uniref:uncharacterized protein n=1 Tax=Onthophagus taurus TaxID=166361 RepID=UPI000C20B489|nr:putative dipeptidase CPSG_01350 [Onthophagus taurus]
MSHELATRVMKSSKYTQVTTPNDNDFGDYQNLGTIIPASELSLSHSTSQHSDYAGSCKQHVNNSEELLLNTTYDRSGHQTGYDVHQQTETNANKYVRNEEFELVCNCSYPQHHRLKPRYTSEQNIALTNRGFCSLTKLDASNSSQYSLDRKGGKLKQNDGGQQRTQQRLDRGPSLKRIQSPEIINIHRGPNNTFYDGYVPENCAVVKTFGYEKDFKCDDYGFKRAQSFKRAMSERSNGNQLRSGGKRRAAGDGIDTPEMDDPELIFELSEQMRDCQCACDHVIYAPGYTTCLPEERFPPAPDVTRRLGASTPITTKPEAGTPPYYRSASAASSSSTSSRIDLSAKHWWIIATVLLLAAAAGVGVPIALKISSTASLDERLEFAARLLQEVPLIDGHNDLPWNIRKFLHNRLKDFKFGEDLRNISPWSTSAWSHTDLPRLKQGHVSAQFWAAYVPCDSQFKDAVQLTLEQIDVIRRLTEMYNPSLTLCTSSQDIRTAYEKNQLCSLIGVEGGHSLAGSLAVLRTLYHVGVRYLTLTSTCNTPWADCSYADMPGRKPEHGGLTNFGKSVVKEMNRLGMIVDLSHVSVGTMRDALDVSKAPVIFSHSSAHALCNSTRNVPDETLRKLALNRGVVMVNFYSHFLTCKDVATVADAVAHINHIREVAGVDNVGLGAGYDGINFVPQGLEDVAAYPTLFAELIGTGKWSVDELKKLAGLNFLRVLEEVERVRDEFRKAKVPPYEDVMMPRPKVNNCTSQDQV